MDKYNKHHIKYIKMSEIKNYHYLRLSGANALDLIKEIRLTEELVKTVPNCYSTGKYPLKLSDLQRIQEEELKVRVKNN